MSGNISSTSSLNMRAGQVILPRVRDISRRARPMDGTNQTGVAVTSYGQGQVTGGLYTVPAFSETRITFNLHIYCVTPEDIQKLSDLIRSLLDASHQHLYDELQTTNVSGGASFFGFFGWGGASASYSDTKHTMDSFGLSERNQEAIVDAMMKIAMQTNDFGVDSMIYNRDHDFDVTGNLFGIVMDATIQQGQYQNQVRFLAPSTHLQSPDGYQLPVEKPLYQLNN